MSKAFPGVQALSDVSLEVRAGETHVLLGENGAGKSTLVKLIAGIHQPDAGNMFLAGSSYRPESPRQATESGVRMIHQELSVLGNLSVAENIFIEHLPQRGGIIDYRRLRREAGRMLERVGLDVDPALPARRLSVARQQMVEIARALTGEARLIIMDEPTASLTDHEIDTLFGIIRQLNSEGVSIIYISHRLQEIYRIGHGFTVLRNGREAGRGQLADHQVDDLVRLMVGRSVADREGHPPPSGSGGAGLLRVENLVPRGAEGGVSFTLHEGEILGIAGLVGAGRTELLRPIYGAASASAGSVFIRGTRVRLRRPRDSVAAGLSLGTENRKEEGLLLEQDCTVNITITDLARIAKGFLLDSRAELTAARKGIEDLGVRTPSPATRVRNLSGGNQQKIVLAKWMFRDSPVLMVDEPTRGIDVGARQ